MAGNWSLSRFTAAIAAILAILSFPGLVVAQQPPPAFPQLPPVPSVIPAPNPPSAAQGATPPVLPPIPSLPPRLQFTIEANTPVKDLLPKPPKSAARGPVLTDDLSKVPEVEFEARPEKVSSDGKLIEQMAYQLAKINHMNAKKRDAFMAALLDNRADLAGLPFAMGDDCRTSGERAKQFTQAVATVRHALSGRQTVLGGQVNADAGVVPAGQARPFWPAYTTLCNQEDAVRAKSDKTLAEHVTVARIGALMQMLAAEPAEMQVGLVKYLTGVPHIEATRALARLAIFSADDDVRLTAVDSLKVRREKDYTDILVNGLRYPWPAVAKRAADAIARIGRSDLIPELVAVLDAADPRMPKPKMVGWTEVQVVREMVKVNHHRNCAMCHAPTGGSGVVPASALTAEVPIQGQSLPSPNEGYRGSTPALMIRVDVTYLRQDFSTVLAVGDAHPWPEMQRFDFLVREREVTDDEATTYREKLTPKEAGVLSPYHKAALAALRDMTGKDTAPTANAWRTLLKMNPKPATPR